MMEKGVVMSPEQRSVAHSIMLIGSFVMLGLVFVQHLIGNPAAIT